MKYHTQLIMDECLAMLRKVAPMTGLGKKVSIVILAGGSVKIPAFRPLIQTYFG